MFLIKFIVPHRNHCVLKLPRLTVKPCSEMCKICASNFRNFFIRHIKIKFCSWHLSIFIYIYLYLFFCLYLSIWLSMRKYETCINLHIKNTHSLKILTLWYAHVIQCILILLFGSRAWELALCLKTASLLARLTSYKDYWRSNREMRSVLQPCDLRAKCNSRAI